MGERNCVSGLTKKGFLGVDLAICMLPLNGGGGGGSMKKPKFDAHNTRRERESERDLTQAQRPQIHDEAQIGCITSWENYMNRKLLLEIKCLNNNNNNQVR